MQFSEKELQGLKRKCYIDNIIEISKKLYDPRIAEYTNASLAGAFCIEDSNQFYTNLAFCLCNIIPFLIKESISVDFQFNVEEYIKSTDEYSQISSLYNEYVAEIANLIKSFSDLDILEIGVLCTLLLKNGYLSKNGNFEYHKFKSDDRNIKEICGARITSGFGVCRHEVLLLTDIYNKLNYKSDYIICQTGLEDSLFKDYPVLFSFLKKEYHAILGVQDDKEYLIFDPTCETIGAISKKDNNLIEARKNCDRKNDLLFYTNSKFANYEYVQGLNEFPSYLNNNHREIKKRCVDMKKRFVTLKSYFSAWQTRNSDLMEEIAALDKLLTGYSDGKVKCLKY